MRLDDHTFRCCLFIYLFIFRVGKVLTINFYSQKKHQMYSEEISYILDGVYSDAIE